MNFKLQGIYLLTAVLFPLTVIGQNIPNSSFELWAGGVPEGWMAVNPLLVTQSNDAHSGNHSVQLEIIEDQGILLNGRLYAGSDGLGFDYFQRPTALTGYYKLSPQIGDHLLVDVFLWADSGLTLVGHKLQTFPNPASNWTAFSVPISYILPDDPDRCTMEISIGYFQDPGGMLWVDDLQFVFANDIKKIENNIPDDFELGQNYPNPFNPTTNIMFTLSQTSYVKLEIINTLGEVINELVSEELNGGIYNYDWYAENLPSGVYIYRLQAGDFIQTKKMILMK
jgi:hypothetical protein